MKQKTLAKHLAQNYPTNLKHHQQFNFGYGYYTS